MWNFKAQKKFPSIRVESWITCKKASLLEAIPRYIKKKKIRPHFNHQSSKIVSLSSGNSYTKKVARECDNQRGVTTKIRFHKRDGKQWHETSKLRERLYIRQGYYYNFSFLFFSSNSLNTHHCFEVVSGVLDINLLVKKKCRRYWNLCHLKETT